MAAAAPLKGYGKISKGENGTLTSLESNVAKALFDLEVNAAEAELRADLHELTFVTARKIPVSSSKTVLVVMVPFRQLKTYRKVHARLVRELEKKFSTQVLVVPQRKIQGVPSSITTRRPRHRTLTAVHENWLEDVCFPAEVVGKRTRVSVNGGKSIKVFLDSREKLNVENRLDAFSSVYRHLTGRNVEYTFQS
ncbi:40S small subunit ribosomal protein eS7 (rpS7) [Andalucia godoyi]|uniref:40S ribosomal protein S7 n=1 Tax=Andalucia godoyi TaxID=505711 RepID=A0A8K0AHP7_ANDGO|nr:40S small subunit ribosomal protein eS7 (rpS7) [Andalucia godoyi]|eukprot:ANDGO_05058.mRNA.1 40S small subunit ribosomal protein eS7 (rpS7)